MSKASLSYVAKYIRDNLPLISNKEWGKLYGGLGGIASHRGALGQLLYGAKMPFLQDLGYVPYTGFYGCELKSIVLPSNCNNIKNLAFSVCEQLESVTIKGEILSVGTSLFSYSGIKEFPFTDDNFKCKRLPNMCFKDCLRLDQVVIPHEVNAIGESCFDGCISLTEIYLPKSIGIIRMFAFKNCPKLSTIYYGGNASDWRRILKQSRWYDGQELTIKCIDDTIIERN